MFNSDTGNSTSLFPTVESLDFIGMDKDDKQKPLDQGNTELDC